MVHVPLTFLPEWREIPSAPCLAGKKKNLDDSSRLHVVEIARVTCHASFQPLQQEKTCNSAHEQTPLSNDTIDSFLRYRDRANDLSAPPRRKKRLWHILLLSITNLLLNICLEGLNSPATKTGRPSDW